MGAVAEARGLLGFSLGCELDVQAMERHAGTGKYNASLSPSHTDITIGKTLLIDIGFDIFQKRNSSLGKTGASDNEERVLSTVADKVVQDADDTEGIGTWTVTEAARIHISSPTVAASQFFRLASADRAACLKIGESLKLPTAPVTSRITLGKDEESQLVEDIRKAAYATCLASFTHGFQLIAR